MSDIPTWHERAMAHPDHQPGMISEDMIRARMAEEIEDLRAEVERLRADNERLRAVLDQLARLGNEPLYGNAFGNVMARRALEAKS